MAQPTKKSHSMPSQPLTARSTVATVLAALYRGALVFNTPRLRPQPRAWWSPGPAHRMLRPDRSPLPSGKSCVCVFVGVAALTPRPSSPSWPSSPSSLPCSESPPPPRPRPPPRPWPSSPPTSPPWPPPRRQPAPAPPRPPSPSSFSSWAPPRQLPLPCASCPSSPSSRSCRPRPPPPP